jgi:hypothetical protein
MSSPSCAQAATTSTRRRAVSSRCKCGQQRPFEQGKPLEILDGQTIEKVDFALPPGDYYVTALFALEPEKRRPPTRYVRTARPDQDGRFKIAGLPPGEYLAIALDSADPAEMTDPEFLGRIEARGVRFGLGEGETKTLDLRLNSPR